MMDIVYNMIKTFVGLTFYPQYYYTYFVRPTFPELSVHVLANL